MNNEDNKKIFGNDNDYESNDYDYESNDNKSNYNKSEYSESDLEPEEYDNNYNNNNYNNNNNNNNNIINNIYNNNINNNNNKNGINKIINSNYISTDFLKKINEIEIVDNNSDDNNDNNSDNSLDDFIKPINKINSKTYKSKKSNVKPLLPNSSADLLNQVTTEGIEHHDLKKQKVKLKQCEYCNKYYNNDMILSYPDGGKKKKNISDELICWHCLFWMNYSISARKTVDGVFGLTIVDYILKCKDVHECQTCTRKSDSGGCFFM